MSSLFCQHLRHRPLLIAVGLVALLLVGCGGSDAAPIDGGTSADAARVRDAAVVDVGGPDTGAADTGAADTSAADTGAADTGAADAITQDAGAPDAADPYPGRPYGQCAVAADCEDIPVDQRQCSRAVPGGICIYCGSEAHCPGDAICSQYGSCAQECFEEADCPPGMMCGASGLCRAADCVDGRCPVPWFGCDTSDRCTRMPCGERCPTGTTCVDDLCVEDRRN